MGLAFFRPQDIDPGKGPIRIAFVLGGVGLVSGLSFSLLLAFAESGRMILNLSAGRAALRGILGSAAEVETW